MPDYVWDTNAATNILREQLVKETLPPCPNCGQPSVVLYPPGPGMDEEGNPITTPGVITCSIKCYEETPAEYLTAVPDETVDITPPVMPTRPGRPRQLSE